MGILLMAMTIAGLILAAIMLAISIYTRNTWLTNFLFGGIVIWLTFYFVMLFGFSAASEERSLERNEPKEFCGLYLDCHMRTAVAFVRQTRSIGNKIANGEFYIVTVKVFSNAKAASLALDTVDAHVVDLEGRRYYRDYDAESSLSPQPAFEKSISPVESFEKEIVFDLPRGLRGPRLDLREGHEVERIIEAVLVDDEDSVFHKRTYFNLADQTETASMEAK